MGKNNSIENWCPLSLFSHDFSIINNYRVTLLIENMRLPIITILVYNITCLPIRLNQESTFRSIRNKNKIKVKFRTNNLG